MAVTISVAAGRVGAPRRYHVASALSTFEGAGNTKVDTFEPSAGIDDTCADPTEPSNSHAIARAKTIDHHNRTRAARAASTIASNDPIAGPADAHDAHAAARDARAANVVAHAAPHALSNGRSAWRNCFPDRQVAQLAPRAGPAVAHARRTVARAAAHALRVEPADHRVRHFDARVAATITRAGIAVARAKEIVARATSHATCARIAPTHAARTGTPYALHPPVRLADRETRRSSSRSPPPSGARSPPAEG